VNLIRSKRFFPSKPDPPRIWLFLCKKLAQKKTAARAAVKHKTEDHLSTKKLQFSDISDYDWPSSFELEAQPPNTIDFVRAENDAIAQTLF
jgi:hypothetical protein